MVRSLIVGGLAFGAAYLAEKQLESVKSDLDRYNALRAMSGEKPFLREQIGKLLGSAAEFSQQHSGEAMGFLASLQNDMLRYARIRSM